MMSTHCLKSERVSGVWTLCHPLGHRESLSRGIRSLVLLRQYDGLRTLTHRIQGNCLFCEYILVYRDPFWGSPFRCLQYCVCLISGHWDDHRRVFRDEAYDPYRRRNHAKGSPCEYIYFCLVFSLLGVLFVLIMSESIKIGIICIIGGVASYLGAFVTGGVSTFSIALMNALGISPQLASITFKLGKLGNTIALVREYHKAKLLKKDFLIGLSLSSFFWAILGSFFITRIPDLFIYSISGISMLTLLIIDVRKSKTNTPHHHEISPRRKSIGYVLEFIATILANLSPAASGAWFYYIRTFVLRVSPLETKAIGSFVSIPWFIGTSIGVFLWGQYNLIYAFALGLWMYGWAYFGAKKSLQLGEEIIRNLIRGFVLISSLYFLYLAYNSYR